MAAHDRCRDQGLEEPVSLSLAQQRLWFLHRLDPEDPAYNVSIAVEIRGPVDVLALCQAARAITLRHEALRTVFHSVDGRPVQRYSPRPVAMRLVDLAQPSPNTSARHVLERLLEHTAAQPFDLVDDPPVRWILLRLATDLHVLLLSVHHIVFDGGSLAVVAHDLESLYAAFTSGLPAGLDSPPVRYAEVARAESEAADSAGALGYWRELLVDAPARLSVFPQRTTDGDGVRRPVTAHLTLGSEQLGQLRRFARRRGYTLYMLLTAALLGLVYRYSGQDDVVVGSPISTREDPALNSVVGMFVNLLPLRVRLAGDSGFGEVASRVRDAVLDAFDHRGAPFERMVDALRPARTPTLSPFFQVLMVHQRLPVTPRLRGVTTRLLAVPPAAAKYELSVTVTEGDEGVQVDFEAEPGVCDRSTLTAFAGHFGTLLRGGVVDPERPLSELPLLSTEEWGRAVAAGCGRAGAVGGSVQELVWGQAGRTPDRVAVVAEGIDGNVHLSYAGLTRWAGRLASRLRRFGVGVESRVGVLLERSVALPVALLGVLRTGAAYVPLDPGDPPERLLWLLADAGVTTVVTSENLRDLVPGDLVNVVDVDGVATSAERLVGRPGAMHPEQAAYVMYTSGSTGRPKGVVIPQRGIVNRLLWMQDEFTLDPDDRVLHKTPTTFDVSLWELLWPLLAGACLVMARPGGHRDPYYLVELMADEQVTTAHFVPSLLGPFLTEVSASSSRPAFRLGGLRRVVCSGEALSARVCERFGSLLSARLVNMYGPTEASVEVTAWPYRPKSGVRIGAPIAGVQVHVLDAAMQPVPARVTGELYIGGLALARGYRERPGLTAAAFLPDPHGGQPGARLYRTGDWARRWPDGAVEFLGRRDAQIKIAGNRIELGEIEETLRGHPAVTDAAVAAHGDEPNRRLVAYAVLQSGSPCTQREFLAYLRRRLPAVMVPAVVLTPDSLPLTASGKLDRNALPPPPPQSHPSTPTPSDSAPGTPLERLVAEAWCATLGLERVGMHENFFDAGGNSLLLLELHARLQRSIHERVRVVDVFRCPTVASLAEFLARQPDQQRLAEQVADRAELRGAGIAVRRSRREARRVG